MLGFFFTVELFLLMDTITSLHILVKSPIVRLPLVSALQVQTSVLNAVTGVRRGSAAAAR